MRRLEELARAAVGFDLKRGDQVAMENVSFSSNAPEVKLAPMDRALEEARTLLRSQPGLARTATLGLCGVLLVLLVLRPMARSVTATLREPMLLTAGATQEVLAPQNVWEQDRQLEEERLPVPPRKSRAQLEAQGIFEHVSEHIRREPAQSTRLLEAWIGSSEEAE